MGSRTSGLRGLLIAASLIFGAAGALAEETSGAGMSGEQARAALDRAFAAQRSGDLEGVFPQVDPVIAALEGKRAEATTLCAENQTQTLALLVNAAAQTDKGGSKAPNGKTIIVDEAFCTALFLKGFVLIDLGRNTEAEGFLRRAHEAEPLNAHFLNEYAEWYKMAGQWQRAHDLFAEAVEKAAYADKDVAPKYRARALRGIGFTEIELGKLDDAEKHMRESLKDEPDSPAARHELDYIASMRKRRTS